MSFGYQVLGFGGSGTAASTGNPFGIFGYGSGPTAVTNLVSALGVVSSDVSGVGTARDALSATEFGGDKGIFGWGYTPHTNLSMSNILSNTGVVAADVAYPGSSNARMRAGVAYGGDKGMYGYGYGNPNVNQNFINLI